MADTIRFPIQTTTVKAPAEPELIIVLASVVLSFPEGGPAVYTDISRLKNAFNGLETPFPEVVIEFLATSAGFPLSLGTGDATGMIGLYGEILAGPGAGKFLLGILGITLTGTKPQIRIFSATIGFAQEVCNVAAYDRLAIGGVGGDVAFPAETAVTVRLRPLRRRSFSG